MIYMLKLCLVGEIEESGVETTMSLCTYGAGRSISAFGSSEFTDLKIRYELDLVRQLGISLKFFFCNLLKSKRIFSILSKTQIRAILDGCVFISLFPYTGFEFQGPVSQQKHWKGSLRKLKNYSMTILHQLASVSTWTQGRIPTAPFSSSFYEKLQARF